jgi:4-oxalocrotonate tautomerase
MPIIQISIVSGRAPEKIKNLIAEVTEATARTLDAPLDSIKVIVTEVEPTHWGSAGETIAERRAKG